MTKTIITISVCIFIFVGCKVRSEQNSQTLSNQSKEQEKNYVSKTGQDAFKLYINDLNDAKSLFNILPLIDKSLSQFESTDRQFRIWCGLEGSKYGCEFTSEFDRIADDLTSIYLEKKRTQAFWEDWKEKKDTIGVAFSEQDAKSFYHTWKKTGANDSNSVQMKSFVSSDSLFSLVCTNVEEDYGCTFNIVVKDAL